VAIRTGERAPEFDLQVRHDERVRLSDFRGKRNVLLVFHPFAYTAVCEEEARDLQENLDTFGNAETDVLFVSCDAWPARQAWREQIGAEYVFASDFWPHGAASRAYGVFDDEVGAPIRGTFLIDKAGSVVWTLVKQSASRRGQLTSGLER
jgi:peroxiredoxin